MAQRKLRTLGVLSKVHQTRTQMATDATTYQASESACLGFKFGAQEIVIHDASVIHSQVWGAKWSRVCLMGKRASESLRSSHPTCAEELPSPGASASSMRL